jgi:leucyl-tRNA synthetase
MGYGTGAVMGVPGHDSRDKIFAEKYSLETRKVYKVKSGDDYHTEGVVINSGEYNDLPTEKAREVILADMVKAGYAKEVVNYKMRDWLISRQRYWGAPIPIVHCPQHGAVAVKEGDLPILLPEIDNYEPSGDGHSPLAKVSDFVNTTCPTCGSPAKRETDTMDGFACSSWYFLRFADPHNNQAPFNQDKAKFWLPVDDYIGGAEHAVMHLLYARFWTKVMFDEKLINFNEPFSTLRNHGMILAPDGSKMSKSKNNTIEPDSLIEQGYGADSIRLMELFIGPWNQTANWSVEGLGGVFRFLQRTWTLVQQFLDDSNPTGQQQTDEAALKRALNQAVKTMTVDLESLGFNTAIASLMEYVNELYKQKSQDGFSSRELWQTALEKLLLLLAPLAPHISEELWQQLGHQSSIHRETWPTFDERYLVSDKLNIVIQINGKLRGQIEVDVKASEEMVIKAAKDQERIASLLNGKDIIRTIYIPSKLINFVVD